MCNNDCDNCEEYCEYNDYDFDIDMSNSECYVVAGLYMDKNSVK